MIRLCAVAGLLAVTAFTCRTAGARLIREQTAFYIQDNIVNSRLLSLAADGTYRQIDVDRISSVEADRGTWQADARGVVMLHPTCAALRFRALLSGPLTIVLDGTDTFSVLPALAEAMRRFLATTGDNVFGRRGVAEILNPLPRAGSAPPLLTLDSSAETFSREDLLELAHQVDDLLWSKATNTYILSPVPNTAPELLVLQDARFQAADLPGVRRNYQVSSKAPPPFYFARVDAATFAHRAGRWKVPALPGWTN